MASVPCVIGTVGDLVEDIAVRLLGPVNVASDTPTRIERRRGGSAANTAVAVARVGHPARFIGQIGEDHVGIALERALLDEGVEPIVRRHGRTGTIVVLVDEHGERTMLTDRAACSDLDDPDPMWLDGLTTLHVPLYSLIGGALAVTSATLIRWAHERGITVGIDASSAAVIESNGVEHVRTLIHALRPDVLLCNELETEVLGGHAVVAALASNVAVVKQGADPALVFPRGGDRVGVPVPDGGPVRDTTGAGDAFAAGFLVAMSGGASAEAAAVAGHLTARVAIDRVSGGA